MSKSDDQCESEKQYLRVSVSPSSADRPWMYPGAVIRSKSHSSSFHDSRAALRKAASAASSSITEVAPRASASRHACAYANTSCAPLPPPPSVPATTSRHMIRA